MRKYALCTLLICLSSLNLLASNAGDWLDIAPDSKSLALGGANLTRVHDAYAPLWNAAGVPEKRQFDSTFSTLMGDVSYTYLGYVHPFDFGSVAFSFLNVGLGDITAASLDGNGRPVVSGNAFSYGSTALMAAMSEGLDKVMNWSPYTRVLMQPWMKNSKIGATLKFLTQSLDTASASGFGLDLGLQHQYDSKTKLAATIYNLLPPNMAWSTNAVDVFPIKLKVGAQYDAADDIRVIGDFDVAGYKQGGIHLGVEYQFNPLLQLRGGYDKNALALGLGLLYQGVNFDFSYTLASYSYMDAATRFSLGYDFTPMMAAKKKDTPIVEEKPKEDNEMMAVSRLKAQQMKETSEPEPAVEPMITPEPPMVPETPPLPPVPVAPVVETPAAPPDLPPQLNVNIPEEGVTVTDKIYGVRVEAKNVKTLLINGDKVIVRGDGLFYRKYPLKAGVNEFVFKAYGLKGELLKAARRVTRK